MNPLNLRPTSRQLAIAWLAVALFAGIGGMAAQATQRPWAAVVALDTIGVLAAMMAMGNWRGWIRL